MNDAVTIRRATPDDARAIATVNVASWRAAYRGLMPDAYLDALSVDDSAPNWQESLGREDARRKRTLVAVIDGAVAGYATVGPDTDDPERGLLYLMYVAPEHWSSGVGRALMDASRDALVALGYSGALLWVLEQNARARRFYEAAGWVDDGHRHVNDYGGTELPAIRMSIAL